MILAVSIVQPGKELQKMRCTVNIGVMIAKYALSCMVI